MLPVSTPPHPATSRAFSLVELLVVLAIMTILVAVSAPVIGSVAGSFQLESASQTMVGQLTFARQKALSSSRAVQVRFYYLPDYNQPANSTPAVCRALQVFVEGDPPVSGSLPLTALTKTIFLPSPVVVSTTVAPNVSPLLPATPLTPGDTDPKISTYRSNYRYALIRYKPDGSTDLAAEANCLTLILQKDKTDVTTGLTKNYQTLRIDPLTGTVRVFQP